MRQLKLQYLVTTSLPREQSVEFIINFSFHYNNLQVACKEDAACDSTNFIVFCRWYIFLEARLSCHAHASPFYDPVWLHVSKDLPAYH